MVLSQSDLDFLVANHSAAMITVGRDGVAKAARVGVALVDGQLWSSGTAARVRTSRLRHDPRCTLYVHDQGFGYLTLETTVTILDGPEVPAQTMRMMRQMQDKATGPLSWFGKELDEPDFLQTMIDEGRVLYQFDVQHAYGMH
jgi:hypothetical protein